MIRLSKEMRTYTFGPDNPPAIFVDPGTTILFETLDALDDQIHSNSDPADKVNLDHVNGATGPVFVNGAMPGDTLLAEIVEIRPWNWGAALIIPGFGFLQETIPGPYTWFIPIEKEGSIRVSDKISLPLKPMIGTIGVSPTQPMTTLTSGQHGGNLDTTDIRPGSMLYLPVLVEGGLFGVGDVHASMGDGEICGTGLECGAEVVIKLDILKDYPIDRPRIETSEEIMAVASAESLNQAIKIALKDMVSWLVRDKGLSSEEAYILISLSGDVRIGQIVDPAVTVRVALPKAIFTSSS
jgi:amidase